MENEEAVVEAQVNEGEGESNNDTISLSKTEYEKMNQTLGSLKRELKDLKKPKEETKETPQKTEPDNVLLQKLEKMALRQAGITHQEDIELAQKTAKKWGVDIDEVIADEDFQAKLKRQQDGRTNVEATTGIKGGAGTSGAKNTPEYWMAKGQPPTPADVPDGKTRRSIIRKMLQAADSPTGKFYNE